MAEARRRTGSDIAWRIAGLYLLFGGLWILFSDRLLFQLVADPHAFFRLQIYKGWFFILVTAAGVFFLVRRYVEALRRQENALQAQFSQISTIFDSLNAVVYVADMQTRKLLYLNRYGEKLFGRDCVGAHCFEVLQDRQSPCENCSNEQLVLDGEPLPPVIGETRNAQNNKWYQCIDKAIRWPDGRLVRLEIAIDITERKEMERLKDELLSSVSHEMHTPLTAILGYAEFMLDNEVPAAEQRSFLQIIQQEAERLNSLINNFLQLQRLKARRESYSFQTVQVRELLESVVRPYAAYSGKHSFRLEIPDHLPPLRGERRGLMEIFDHLLSNACKYSPAGGEIVLGAHRREAEVVLWVRDSGKGIPAEDLERVFDRFYRIDNSDRRETGGTGLGLALVREIAHEHGGRVWAESRPGQGSTFFVALPGQSEVRHP